MRATATTRTATKPSRSRLARLAALLTRFARSGACVGVLPREPSPFESARGENVSRALWPCPSPGRAGSPASGSPRAPGRRVVGRQAGSGIRKRVSALPVEGPTRLPRGPGTLRRWRGEVWGHERSTGTTTHERSAEPATGLRFSDYTPNYLAGIYVNAGWVD
jgi:hypothetical protein